MGCEFQFSILKAKDVDSAAKEVHEMIEEAKYHYGHRGYTGSLAEATGFVCKMNVVLAGREEAEEWLDEHAEKWGPAVIVRDANGVFYVGANCSS